MKRALVLVLAGALGGCGNFVDLLECDSAGAPYRQRVQTFESSCRTISLRGGGFSTDCSAYPVTRTVDTPRARQAVQACAAQRRQVREAAAREGTTPPPPAADPNDPRPPASQRTKEMDRAQGWR